MHAHSYFTKKLSHIKMKKSKIIVISIVLTSLWSAYIQSQTLPEMRPVSRALEKINTVQNHDQTWLKTYIHANYQDDKGFKHYSVHLHQQAMEHHTSAHNDKQLESLAKGSICQAFLKLLFIFEKPFKEISASEKALFDANTNAVRNSVYPNLSAEGQKKFENNPAQFATQLARITLTMKILMAME